MSIKKFTHYIDYIANQLFYSDNELNYEVYMEFHSKIRDELDNHFRINNTDDIFNKNSKKIIMLDYNFSIIFKKIKQIYNQHIMSLPTIDIEYFEKRLSFIISKFNKFENILKPIYTNARLIVQESSILYPQKIFDIFFQDFLHVNKSKLEKTLRYYFLDSELDYYYTLPTTIDYITEHNKDLLKQFSNIAKDVINIKYLNLYKDKVIMCKDLKSSIQFTEDFSNKIRIKYDLFLDENELNDIKKQFISYFLKDLQSIFSVNFDISLKRLFDGDLEVYPQIEYFYNFINLGLNDINKKIIDFLKSKIVQDNFIETYTEVLDIANKYFNNDIISQFNKSLEIKDETSLCKYFNKYIEKNLKDKLLMDDPVHYHLYDLINKDMLGVLYQSSLTKRLMFNNDINLECEYHFLDQMTDLPIKYKLNTMLYEYTLSHSFTKHHLSSLNINLLFCRDQLWPFKRESKKKDESYILPEQEIISSMYSDKYEGRHLIWKNELTTCTITLNTFYGSYDLIVNPEIVKFLQKFNELDKVVNTSIDDKYFSKLIKFKIFKKKDNLYIFNKKFKAKLNLIKCNI